MEFKKIHTSETEYKILQIRDDGTERFVDDDHGGYLRWLASGNIPDDISYVPPDIPIDSDPKLLRKAKKRKISNLRMIFLSLIEEEFDRTEISIRNMEAIVNLSQTKQVGTKFNSMVTVLAPYIAWKNAYVQQIKACTLVSDVDAIFISYP